MTPLPVTLATAAACIFLNMWLGMRVSSLRYKLKVSVGDGGQEPLLRRMRAQANFIENAPFVLILIGGLELSGASRLGLALISAIFILARIAHAIGMDGGSAGVWRRNGILTSTFVSLALALWALARVAAPCLGR